MNPVDWVQAFGGLGLLLFSLRYLTNTLNESVASRFRPFLDRLLSSRGRCILSGMVAAVLFQASSVLVVVSMGLVDSALVTLEQAFLIVLGATVGTTIKMWFLVSAIAFGPLLIGVGTFSILVVRNPLVRELLKIMTAVGFTFLGLDMLAQSTVAIQQQPEFVAVLRSYDADNLASQMVVVLAGAALAALMQSGSAVVALVMGLSVHGTIHFETGAAAVLGANIGTASVGLLASLQSARDGRRIAFAHTLAKLIGVLITLFFFPSFLAAVKSLAEVFVSPFPEPLLLAAVHTSFNLVNTFWWVLWSGFFLGAIRRLIPGEDKQSLGLPKGVRRMLNMSPQRASREAEAQFRQMEMLVRSLYDHTLGALAEGRHSPALRSRRVWLERSFSSLKETLHDLLFALSRQPDRAGDREKIMNHLAMIEIYSSLTRTCYLFNDHLEHGFVVDQFEIAPKVATSIKELQQLLDGLWLTVLLPDQAPSALADTPEKSLEEAVLEHVQELGSGHQEYLTWLFEIAGYMRTIARHLGEVQQLRLREGLEVAIDVDGNHRRGETIAAVQAEL